MSRVIEKKIAIFFLFLIRTQEKSGIFHHQTVHKQLFFSLMEWRTANANLVKTYLTRKTKIKRLAHFINKNQ